MLTQRDLSAIKNLIEVVIDQKGVITKIEDLENRIGFLPSKDDFYAEMEKIYKKLDDMELEKKVFVARSAENTRRLDLLEKIHPEGRHQTV